MSDSEIIEACAKAMGYRQSLIASNSGSFGMEYGGHREVFMNGGAVIECYDPLHDDAQAMALVKKFRLDCEWYANELDWCCTYWDTDASVSHECHDADLNRAICLTVAKLASATERA